MAKESRTLQLLRRRTVVSAYKLKIARWQGRAFREGVNLDWLTHRWQQAADLWNRITTQIDVKEV